MLPNWQLLSGLDDDRLGRLDIAAINLACAEGLPGAPTAAQVAECLDRLDHYARCVADYTQRCRPDYDSRPGHYDHSQAKFRMVCMVRLLQKAFGVRYNEAKMAADAPFTVADSFIHGALLGDGGTCATLPVVYAAVGRRLGYPLKLVATASAEAEHQFVRWDEPGGERFNFEANNTSMDSPSDDEYRSGRYSHVTAKVERLGCYLVSQTPRHELARFPGSARALLVGHRKLADGNQRLRLGVVALATEHSAEEPADLDDERLGGAPVAAGAAWLPRNVHELAAAALPGHVSPGLRAGHPETGGLGEHPGPPGLG